LTKGWHNLPNAKSGMQITYKLRLGGLVWCRAVKWIAELRHKRDTNSFPTRKESTNRLSETSDHFCHLYSLLRSLNSINAEDVG